MVDFGGALLGVMVLCILINTACIFAAMCDMHRKTSNKIDDLKRELGELKRKLGQ